MAKVSHIVLPVADVDRSRDWQKNANGRKRMRSSRDSPPSVEKPNESASTPYCVFGWPICRRNRLVARLRIAAPTSGRSAQYFMRC